MKFIHAADLHLDTPFASIKNFSKQLQNDLRKSTYTAATKVFDTAIHEKVDFVILAGDTYDNTDRSLNAQEFLKNQFNRLKDNGINVYMVYGNHDYYRNDFSTIKFPDNVYTFSDAVTTEEFTSRDGMKVGISGFSYYQQHIQEDKVKEYPARENFDYQIGILHAGVGDGNYAPFTVNELLAKGYDYWALGHIHKRQVLNEKPYVIYPGDTQGRNQNETGIKGFYLVNVLNSVTEAKFVASSSYVWDKAKIDVSAEENLDSLFAKIDGVLDKDQKELLTVKINNAQKLDPDLIKSIDRGDVIRHYSQSASSAMLYKLELKYNNTQQLQEIDQKYWDESADNVFDLNDIKDLDKKLFGIDVIREHMEDPEFLSNIKESTQSVINKKFIGEE